MNRWGRCFLCLAISTCHCLCKLMAILSIWIRKWSAWNWFWFSSPRSRRQSDWPRRKVFRNRGRLFLTFSLLRVGISIRSSHWLIFMKEGFKKFNFISKRSLSNWRKRMRKVLRIWLIMRKTVWRCFFKRQRASYQQNRNWLFLFKTKTRSWESK